MIKKRICKDRRIIWPILTNGEKKSLEGRDLTLEIRHKYDEPYPLDFTVSENNVIFNLLDIPRAELGAYSLSLWENRGKSGQTVVDKCNALCLVSTTCEEDAENILTSGGLIVGLPGSDGKSAYEIAVKHGFTGTEEQWLESLRAQISVDDIPSVEEPLLGDESIIVVKEGSLMKAALSEINTEKSDVDDALSPTSENPVQNKVITAALDSKASTASVVTAINDKAAEITGSINSELKSYALKTELPDVSGLPTIQEVNEAISSQKFKTVNGETITGEGNIMIEAGESVEIDTTLDQNSSNAIANSAVAEAIARLNSKVFPLSLSVSGGGVFQKGTSKDITVRWTVKEGDTVVAPDSVTVNGETVDPTVSSKTFTGITESTTYMVKASKGGVEKSGSTSATFVNASYYGAVPADFVPSEDAIKSLSSRISASKAFTTTFNLANQKSCYAYPKSLGALASIKDANNFDYIGGYTRTELTANGETYYVYVLTDPTTINNFKQIYA